MNKLGKYISILIIDLLFLSPFITHAQSINSVKGSVDHNKSLRPCLVVSLDPETKTLKKAWIRFLKKEYGFKLKGVSFFGDRDLLYAKEAEFNQLSSKQLDFYTQIIEDETQSEMKVFASFGYDIYINEDDYPDEFMKMKEMLNTFLKQYLPKYYKKQVALSTKKVKKLKKEISSLKKKIKSNGKSIENHIKEGEELNSSVKDNSEKLNSAERELKNNEERMKIIKRKLQKL